jgi:hypothetical protein
MEPRLLLIAPTVPYTHTDTTRRHTTRSRPEVSIFEQCTFFSVSFFSASNLRSTLAWWRLHSCFLRQRRETRKARTLPCLLPKENKTPDFTLRYSCYTGASETRGYCFSSVTNPLCREGKVICRSNISRDQKTLPAKIWNMLK